MNNSPYKNVHHASRALASLKKMREQSSLCDAVLVVDDGSELPVHRSFLAACSEYFLAMLMNFKEGNQSRIELQGVNHSTLKLLIDYAYTAKIHINEENVQLLLPAADLLQFPDVKDACFDFLLAQLQPSNCLGFRSFVDIHGCSELLENIDRYIEDHFSEIVEHDEFLEIDKQQFAQLISNDRLTVPTEEVIFESVISWIRADLETRKSFLPQLMEQVQLPLLSLKYLSLRVKEEPLVKESLECQKFLVEAFEYHSHKSKENSSLKFPKTKPRHPRGLPKVLAVVGGTLGSEVLSSVEYFDFQEKKWHKMSDSPTLRYVAASTVLGNRLYVVGGRNTTGFSLRTVDVYDSITGQWSKCAEMKTERASFNVAVLGGRIYAVGGYDEEDLNSVEVYDPLVNEWREVSPKLTKCREFGVGVVKNRLYAIGGFHRSQGYLSSVECYHPEENEWKYVSEMSTKRAGVGIGVLNGIIYAVGGFGGSSSLRSVEAYNPETNQWKPISHMKEYRNSAKVVAYNGSLYVVGGNLGALGLSSVEVYSPETDSWTMFSSSMRIERYFASVALIEKPRVHY